MCEERVTQQHRGSWAKLPRRSPATPAHVGPIHDIVVHERRQVHEFDHRSNPHKFGRNDLRTPPSAEEDERRPDALARGIDAIIRHRADLWLKRGELTAQEAIELRHMRSKQCEYAGEGMTRWAGHKGRADGRHMGATLDINRKRARPWGRA